MASYVQKLKEQSLIQPPKWLPNNTLFEGITGSVAYAVSNDTSDMDIIGFCMPPKDTLFPHLRGEIRGFGTPGEIFEQFQQHHVKSLDGNKEFDITIYSLVKFFQLTMENNPNMVDALFLPRRCVLYSSPIYEYVRSNRHLFLHKGCWHKFRSYAYSQLYKIKNGVNRSNPNRKKSIEDFGYDVKFAYHIVRLILEVEQILVEHDLNLERNSDMLKSVRRGEWTLEEIEEWFSSKEKDLELVYHSSTLRVKPDEPAIKKLLIECIEQWYGSITSLGCGSTIVLEESSLVTEMQTLLDKYK